MAVKVTDPTGAPVDTLLLSSGTYKVADLKRPEDLPEVARFYLRRKGYKVEANGVDQDVPNKQWLKDDLIAHATRHGIEVGESATKAEILTAITQA